MFPGKAMAALNFGRAVGLLLLTVAPSMLSAQVGPEMKQPLSIHLFGNYTSGSSHWGIDDSHGFTLGGFVQAPHLWGIESRGSCLHWGTKEYRYDALVGPRLAFHFSRFSPYGVVLGGVGHVVTFQTPSHLKNVYTTDTAAEWKVLSGVDFYAGHHFSVRLGEVSYAKVYVFQNSLSSIDFSGGVAYRIRLPERGAER